MAGHQRSADHRLPRASRRAPRRHARRARDAHAACRRVAARTRVCAVGRGAGRCARGGGRRQRAGARLRPCPATGRRRTLEPPRVSEREWTLRSRRGSRARRGVRIPLDGTCRPAAHRPARGDSAGRGRRRERAPGQGRSPVSRSMEYRTGCRARGASRTRDHGECRRVRRRAPGVRRAVLRSRRVD